MVDFCLDAHFQFDLTWDGWWCLGINSFPCLLIGATKFLRLFASSRLFALPPLCIGPLWGQVLLKVEINFTLGIAGVSPEVWLQGSSALALRSCKHRGHLKNWPWYLFQFMFLLNWDKWESYRPFSLYEKSQPFRPAHHMSSSYRSRQGITGLCFWGQCWQGFRPWIQGIRWHHFRLSDCIVYRWFVAVFGPDNPDGKDFGLKYIASEVKRSPDTDPFQSRFWSHGFGSSIYCFEPGWPLELICEGDQSYFSPVARTETRLDWIQKERVQENLELFFYHSVNYLTLEWMVQYWAVVDWDQ